MRYFPSPSFIIHTAGWSVSLWGPQAGFYSNNELI